MPYCRSRAQMMRVRSSIGSRKEAYFAWALLSRQSSEISGVHLRRQSTQKDVECLRNGLGGVFAGIGFWSGRWGGILNAFVRRLRWLLYGPKKHADLRAEL